MQPKLASPPVRLVLAAIVLNFVKKPVCLVHFTNDLLVNHSQVCTITRNNHPAEGANLGVSRLGCIKHHHSDLDNGVLVFVCTCRFKVKEQNQVLAWHLVPQFKSSTTTTAMAIANHTSVKPWTNGSSSLLGIG